MSRQFEIQQIGVISSPFKTKDDCPIQGVVSASAEGRIEVFPQYGEGLDTIEGFTHLYLFYIFDRAGEVILSRETFLDDEKHGVFASRHPCRPNSIGISIVKLEGREGNTLRSAA
jgi:tRNA-Thr(GGU) m(6)t(6)A37 methyltransferase TsaA